MKVLEKNEREKILELFSKNLSLKFNELEKLSGIRSNELSYHLKKLMNDGLITKNKENYILTRRGETTAERIAHFTGKEVGHMVVVIIAVTKNNKILLLKRNRRPFKDYWGMIGGKTKFDESIPESVEREVEEETGIKVDINSVKVRSVMLERVKTNQGISHGNILILTEAKPLNDITSEIVNGQHINWFKLSDLKYSKIILSDMWMIENFIEKKKEVNIPHIIMEEKDGDLTSFYVV
jgi:ADP-ribose pyrophosphatase YjhB (NUDIX family)